MKVSGRLTLHGARAAVCAAANGAGIASLPGWAAHASLEDGSVVEILPEWAPDHRDLWAVFPSNRYLAHRVRLLVDHLKDWFKDGL